MLRSLILFFALLSGITCISQNSSSAHSTKRWIVATGPFFTSAPGVWGGYVAVQRRVGKQWGLLAELGTAPAANRIQDRFKEWIYIRTALEAKWFFADFREVGLYFSSYNSFDGRSFTRMNHFYSESAIRSFDSSFFYDAAQVRSPILTNVLRLGFEIRAGENFLIDFAGGAGVRSFFTHYQSFTIRRLQTAPFGEWVLSYPAYQHDGNLSRLAINLSMRLGWRF